VAIWEDRTLTGTSLVVLSVTFGGYGIGMLIAAYRTVNHSAWTEKALLGSLGILATALLGHVVAGLFS
jgi:hypothetical protein